MFFYQPLSTEEIGKQRISQGLSSKSHARPMKKQLNTLFVTTQGAYLSKEGETVVVKVENEIRMRLPIHTLDGIICFGNILCSPFLLGFCAERDVALSFLTEQGRFLARVQGPVSGNVLLRREQYRRADDPVISAEIATAVLMKAGVSVEVANDGIEAVETWQKESFDAILMDVQMPDMDGFEATRRIRKLEEKKEKKTPIIAMTANALKGDEEKCLAAGMDGYVSKPINQDLLFQTLYKFVKPEK